MEILKKIAELQKYIQQTDELVNELSATQAKEKNKKEVKEKDTVLLKEELNKNIKKIDEIIENYNANT